jgi:hypothetical protein
MKGQEDKRKKIILLRTHDPSLPMTPLAVLGMLGLPVTQFTWLRAILGLLSAWAAVIT